MTLTVDEVLARAEQPEPADRVIFKVDELYGLSTGTKFPLNKTESIETGPMSLTMDPRTDAATNIGMVDFGKMQLRVRYGVQVIFPGLHELVLSGQHDLNLLGPVRAIATDECTLTPDLTGWRALGCLELLPGSMWSGAKGG